MMTEQQVLVRSLVFIGGGHAHVHVLKMMGMKPIPGVQVTLITRDVDTPYSGMLPGHIAGYYTREECHIDLQKIARFANANLVHTEAIGIDTVKRLVHCKDGRPPIRYDVLSIDIGSTPKFVETQDPVLLRRVTRVKPIDSFSTRWDSIVERVLARADRQPLQGQQQERLAPSGGTVPSRSSLVRVMIVGGGAGGVELALAMQHRLKHLYSRAGRDPDTVVVGIVNRGKAILSSHNRGVQKIFKRVLAEKNVELHNCKEVVDVRDPPEGVPGAMGTLSCADGTEIAFSEAIWCTNSGAAKWLRDTGLALNDQGFIEVNDYLGSTNTPGVFAVGDCCHMIHHPRPKAGVFAVRQGPPLEINLRRMLEGRSMKRFTPQKTFMGLISTGDERAVLSWAGLAKEGAFMWKFKDYIDTKWMRMYKELPQMNGDAPPPRVKARFRKLYPTRALRRHPQVPRAIAAGGPAAIEIAAHAKMRCGGCGSKVGAGVLRRVLTRLGVGQVGDVRTGGAVMGMSLDDAAVVAPPPEPGALTVHTIDFFRSFVSDPYIFGRIAANHALSDVHAMGAEPTTALAIVTVPFGGESQVEGTLEQLLAGALRALNEAGCSLIGGHTCEGAEVALGFSVNGVIRGGAVSLMGKGGAMTGDALVLTKPVGTGAVLAAEMRGQARTTWVEPAIRSMLESNGPAADVLRIHGARACTDVTGFGVVGHLAEMLRASPPVIPASHQSDGSSAYANRGTHESAVDESKSTSPSPSRLLRAELKLDSVPVLPGAVEVLEAGITSTLQGQNERDNAANVEDWGLKEKGGRRESARFRLLFDPQTAGGLLGSVPQDRAEACIASLRQVGCKFAAVIGTVMEESPTGVGLIKVTLPPGASAAGAAKSTSIK